MAKWLSKVQQFSQIIVVYAMSLVALTIFGNYILSWYGKETLSDMAIAVITAFSTFITGGYFTLTAVRDCSKNKYGIKENNDETVG